MAIPGDRPDDPLGDESPGGRVFTEGVAAAAGAGSIPPDEQVDEERDLEDERLGVDRPRDDRPNDD